MALTDKLTAIADAIRAKTGGTAALTLDQMPTEIAGIKVGGGGDGSPRVVENVVNIDSLVSVNGETITGMQLDYIQSTGTQYFDTGIVPDASTEIEMKYSVQSILDYGSHMLSTKGFYFPFPRKYTGVYNFLASRMGNELNIDLAPSTDTIYTIKAFPSSKVVINGTERGTVEAGNSVVTGSLYMNTYGGTPGDSMYTAPAKIYYCKIWQNGTLVRNFIPYKSASGEVGMLDLVENKVYTSMGTGQFAAGSVVGYNPS